MAKRKSKSSSGSSKSSSPRLSPDPVGQTSFDLASPDRPFDNILNFRDVGSSINKIHGSRIVKEGVLYRSARPDDASERDKRRLVDELAISTVIDLRSNTEHVMATKKRRASLYPETAEQDKPVPANSNEHVLELPGVRRYGISLTGKAFEKALLWRLDWYNFMKVLGLSASGYRSDAVSIVCRQVMQPRGLIGLAKDTLDNSTSEMRELFDLLCDESIYPTVVHCTQGKDRTGLVIMLLLFLTNAVPLDDITADYSKSEAELIPEMEERMKEIRAIGLDEEYTKCPPGFIRAMKTYLDNKYGGVEGYLLSIGISRDKQEKVRSILLA